MAGADELSPFYGYIPTLWVTVVILGLFSLSFVVHAYQAIRYRKWSFLITATLAASTESFGWGARLWSHFAPKNLTPFLIQTITTGNGPTLLIAAYFVTLAEIIRRLGPCYSRMKPRMYTIVFCSADLVALSVQGVGGGLAATAAADEKSPELGGNIMLAGIIIQMVALTLYIALAAEFMFRYVKDRPFKRPNEDTIRGAYMLDTNMKTLIWSMTFGTVLLYIRSIYRVVELTDGWDGVIITTEIYFIILDGVMIIGAIWCMNIFHPGRLLGNESSAQKTVVYEGVGFRETDNTYDPLLSDKFDSRTMHSRNDSSPYLTHSRNTSSAYVAPKLEEPAYR